MCSLCTSLSLHLYGLLIFYYVQAYFYRLSDINKMFLYKKKILKFFKECGVTHIIFLSEHILAKWIYRITSYYRSALPDIILCFITNFNPLHPWLRYELIWPLNMFSWCSKDKEMEYLNKKLIYYYFDLNT
jgi:hypothetical protein